MNELEAQPRAEKTGSRVRLQASNLKKPIGKFISVSVIFERGDFLKRVNEIKNKD